MFIRGWPNSGRERIGCESDRPNRMRIRRIRIGTESDRARCKPKPNRTEPDPNRIRTEPNPPESNRNRIESEPNDLKVLLQGYSWFTWGNCCAHASRIKPNPRQNRIRIESSGSESESESNHLRQGFTESEPYQMRTESES